MTQQSDSAVQTAGRMKKVRFILMVVMPLLALFCGVGIYLYGGQSVETDNAYVKADKVDISPEISGNVVHVSVVENQTVNAGDPLFDIDPEPFEVALDRARAQLAQTRTSLNVLKASYEQKKAELRLARSQYDFALKEEKRNQRLLKTHVISSSVFDGIQQNTKAAGLQLDADQQALNQVIQNLGGNVDTPVEQLPDFLAAKAQLDQVLLDLQHTHVVAMASGIVHIPPRVGQYLSSGDTALSLIENRHYWIEANYPEKDLTYVHPGQLVDIHIDTYPQAIWKGEVESVSPGTSAEFSLLPAQNGTGNWVKVAQRVAVKIMLDPDQNKEILRAGLSSVVSINTGHKRSLLGFSF